MSSSHFWLKRQMFTFAVPPLREKAESLKNQQTLKAILTLRCNDNKLCWVLTMLFHNANNNHERIIQNATCKTWHFRKTRRLGMKVKIQFLKRISALLLKMFLFIFSARLKVALSSLFRKTLAYEQNGRMWVLRVMCRIIAYLRLHLPLPCTVNPVHELFLLSAPNWPVAFCAVRDITIV